VVRYVVSALAGSSYTWGHADGVGSKAKFNTPTGVAVDKLGNPLISWDSQVGGESVYLRTDHRDSPADAFEKRWSGKLLEQVLLRLRAEFAAAGKIEAFDPLKRFLWGADSSVSYAELCSCFNGAEGGGVLSDGELNGHVLATIADSTISNNYAGSGSGITSLNHPGSGSLTLAHCTLSGNYGFYYFRSPQISNLNTHLRIVNSTLEMPVVDTLGGWVGPVIGNGADGGTASVEIGSSVLQITGFLAENLYGATFTSLGSNVLRSHRRPRLVRTSRLE